MGLRWVKNSGGNDGREDSEVIGEDLETSSEMDQKDGAGTEWSVSRKF